MSDDRTQSLDIDPLGDATRSRAEIKMTGAQLMDLIDERDGLRAALVALAEDCAPGPGEGHIPNAPSERSYMTARALLDGR